MGAAVAKKRTGKLFIRIVAAVMAFIMVSGILLYQESDIGLIAAGLTNKSAHLAALQLLKNSPYANASRLKRMSLFARNLLRGERSFEDYDAAVQIAVAQANYGEAIAFNEKALAAFEGTQADAVQLYLRMGYLYVMQEDYEKALEWLDLGGSHARAGAPESQ